MKKLLCWLVAAVVLMSCNDEKHVWVFQDMMYFLGNSAGNDGYASPVSSVTASPGSQLDLTIVRNGFSAERHPKQTVKIVVEEDLSTAKAGSDFSIDPEVLKFQDKNTMQLPLRVNIRKDTSGKQIVLRLDYGYYDECSLEGRKADKLTIKIR